MGKKKRMHTGISSTTQENAVHPNYWSNFSIYFEFADNLKLVFEEDVDDRWHHNERELNHYMMHWNFKTKHEIGAQA